MLELTCDHCGKQFEREEWQHNASMKRGRMKTYCSRKCAADAARSPNVKKTNWRKQIGANKEYCSHCGEQSLTIIESKKNILGHRYRRKECRNCGIRCSTYEIPADFYDELKTRMASSKDGKANICFNCEHDQINRCGLGFPEYKTDESYDCTHAMFVS